jgi:hypothetical protein
MSSISSIKEQKGAIIRRHAQADNVKALAQVLTTLGSLALVWWTALLRVHVSHWLTVVPVLLISLFTLRAFVLMHECGHGSLFRTQRLNRHSVFSWAWSRVCRSTCGHSIIIFTTPTMAIGRNTADSTQRSAASSPPNPASQHSKMIISSDQNPRARLYGGK